MIWPNLRAKVSHRGTGEAMPWINLTVRRGTFTRDIQHAAMAKLTDALMFWEKIPDTPEARKKMKGWVYEVAEDVTLSYFW